MVAVSTIYLKKGQQTIKDDLKPLFQSEDGDSKIKEFGLFNIKDKTTG